ncbi:type I-C CRISPR-associated endonuclease Cas1c [Hydrogenoanaerobacterium sp.]|uniref:type I-C CRISPR-associated endonuclease Cas1c n=1 Tax=Hydrogenoanaerobacterium sp. TaxID=2953763 RepID=UPI00289D2B5D|nr:type I-C CRISPR-associated endonuclease Cas1c [Hydrogenoanaerobacterium sp.]
MKKLLNTLYVTTENAYLALDGENVVVQSNGDTLGRLPIHMIDGIMAFGYIGASPALMGKCAEMNKSLVFLKPSGRFLAKVTGKSYGNILLRREQYRVCEDEVRSLAIAKNIISAKFSNCNAVLSRAVRDHALRIDTEKFAQVGAALQNGKVSAYHTQSASSLRGLEGECASLYFSLFDDMILQQKDDFVYKFRSRRPPMDNVNAMLSFSYSLLTSMCVSALESVGLDAYAGIFHTERPGRCSLALDLLEEFRAPFADRFVLTAINKRSICDKDFIEKENGGILLTEDGRKKFLSLWQQKKKEEIMHPFLQEKVEWGLLPYVQAMLLAKYIRGDIDAYPPFIWR